MQKPIWNQNIKTNLFTAIKTLMHFKIKSSATHSCFQHCSKTESAKSRQKNRITLEKMATPNAQEKNTLEFLEEYDT